MEARGLEDLLCIRHLGRYEVLGAVGLFIKVMLEFGPAFHSCLIRCARCGLFGADSKGSVPFDDDFGMYWLGWGPGVRGTLGLALGPAGRVGWLDVLTIPTASFANFRFDF